MPRKYLLFLVVVFFAISTNARSQIFVDGSEANPSLFLTMLNTYSAGDIWQLGKTVNPDQYLLDLTPSGYASLNTLNDFATDMYRYSQVFESILLELEWKDPSILFGAFMPQGGCKYRKSSDRFSRYYNVATWR